MRYFLASLVATHLLANDHVFSGANAIAVTSHDRHSVLNNLLFFFQQVVYANNTIQKYERSTLFTFCEWNQSRISENRLHVTVSPWHI